MRRYPRIVESQKRGANRHAPCKLCGEIGTRIVWVQTTYMRGDDEKYWLCESCWRKDQGDLEKHEIAHRLMEADGASAGKVDAPHG